VCACTSAQKRRRPAKIPGGRKWNIDENRSYTIVGNNVRITYGANSGRHGHLRGIRRRPWRSDGHWRWLWHDRWHAGSGHFGPKKPRRYWSPLENKQKRVPVSFLSTFQKRYAYNIYNMASTNFRFLRWRNGARICETYTSVTSRRWFYYYYKYIYIYIYTIIIIVFFV